MAICSTTKANACTTPGPHLGDAAATATRTDELQKHQMVEATYSRNRTTFITDGRTYVPVAR